MMGKIARRDFLKVGSAAIAALTAMGAASLLETEASAENDAESREKRKQIKILGIGNSWCRDTLRWLWSILDDAGYDTVIGQPYMGGATLQDMYYGIYDANYAYTHSTWKQKTHDTYQYWRYSKASPAKTPSDNEYCNGQSGVGLTLEQIVKSEEWDVILFMGTRSQAGYYTQYVDGDWDINSFIDIVKSWCYKEPKIGWMVPWAHAEETTGTHWKQATTGYSDLWSQSGNDRHAFYELLNSAIQRETVNGLAHMGDRVSFVVNIGQAVYYARKNGLLKRFGYDFQRAQDNTHLSNGMPMFLAGFTVANAVLDVAVNDISFFPKVTVDSVYENTDGGEEVDGGGIPSQAMALMCKKAAVKANSDLLWLN